MVAEITSEMRGQTLILSFNRPQRANALSLEMAAQLFNALKPATTDHGIRAVMLRGQGGTFMDGLDMELYAGDYMAALDRANQMTLPYHSAIRELQVMDKPVLAAVEGVAAGPGLSLMLACDFVIATRGTRFNCKFTSYGMTPDGGASLLLTRKLGAARAAELLMLSDDFSAESAEKWGLVNRVVEAGKLQDEAYAWVDRLVTGPTRAYGGTKRLIAKAFEQDLNAQLGLEHTHWGASSRTFDFRDAVKAYFVKRPPKFTGM